MMRSALILVSLALLACGGGSRPPGAGDGDAQETPATVCATGDAPYATFTEAIAAAAPGAEIFACPGTYAETLVVRGQTVLLGGDPGMVIIDAGGAGTTITVVDGADVTLHGLVVRGGFAENGGGIRCAHSALRADQLVVEANEANDDGGGLHASGCQLTITDSTFRDNLADDGGGLFLVSDGTLEGNTIAGNHAKWSAGGIYIAGHAPVLRGNHIDGNTALDDGGGAYIHQSQALLIENRVTNNRSADDGGGLRIFTSAARLERNQLSGNQADGDGGGMKISHAPAELIDNVIRENVAAGCGGGLELDNDASQVRGGIIAGNQAGRGGGIHASLSPWFDGLLADLWIEGNQAGRGGGVYLEENFQAFELRGLTVIGNRAEIGAGLSIRRTEFALSNSLIVGNIAVDEGGGLHVGGTDRDLWVEPCGACPPTIATGTIDFVVVHGNGAAAGAAMWLQSPDLTVADSILVANTGAGARVVVAGQAPLWRYNASWPAEFTGMADPTGIDGNLAADPGFLDPNQGDFHLAAGSPCIDAGDPEILDRDTSRADMGLFGGPDAP